MESGTGETLCPSTKPQEVNGILDGRVAKVVVSRIFQKKHHPEKWVRRSDSFFWG